MEQVALCICACFMLWLFIRDRKLRPMSSWGLWVSLLWMTLLGSRSIGRWLGADLEADPSTDMYVEGSPLDRNIFLALIVLAVVALYKRKIQWGKVLSGNKWLCFLFLYYGISIAWSDFPFVSFKRWIKDVGNVLMVLLILTEGDPVQATRAVVSRYIYFAIPLSLVLIYFLPQFGLSMLPYTGEITIVGVTTDKNELGVVLTISGLFIAWDLIEVLSRKGWGKVDVLARIILFAMVLWMISIAKSATGLICLTLGIATLLLMRIAAIREQVRHLGAYAFFITFAVVGLFFFTDVTELLVGVVEKDMTFTGRTDIWAGLLQEPINPLVGTGYSSFWLKPSMMSSFHNIIQAHNGYLETYLNGGIIGVCFLVALIVATAYKIKNEVLSGSSFAVLFFSIFIITLFYNLSETMFNRLDLVWFMFLVGSIRYMEKESEPDEATASQLTGTALLDGGRFGHPGR